MNSSEQTRQLLIAHFKKYPNLKITDIFKFLYQSAFGAEHMVSSLDGATEYILKEFLLFLPLFKMIDKSIGTKNLTIAIEGGSASGKSTLADLLSKIYDCTVFHMDDFFLQPHQRTADRYNEIGGNIDKERFLAEILIPLSQNKIINYKKFDCSSMALGETITVTPKNLTIIEGAYSMHPEFEKYYDFSVFLNISKNLQRERITKRNPNMADMFFDKWIPLEEKYFSGTNAKERCNICIKII